MTDSSPSSSSSSSASTSHLPLVLAPDARADAAVLAADAISFATEGDGGDGTPLEARDTPESRLEARITGGPTLDQAMDALELENMTALEVAELESGDAGRMAAVLKVKEGPATATASTGRSPEEDGSSLNRVSIKALPPPLRLKLVSAISRARDGGDFEQALREMLTAAPTPTPAPYDDGAQWQGQAYDHGQQPGDGNAHAAAEQAQDLAAMPEPMPQVEDLQTQLVGMKAEYDRAKAEYDPRAHDLLEEMMDVKLDLREAQRGQAVFMQEQRASYERVMESHADLMTDAESPFLDLCDMTISLAERNNDPILTQPDWPERIAKQVRGKFFGGGADARSAGRPGGRPQAQIPVPPAPHQRVRLPGSPVGNGFAPGSITPETALAEFDQLTPEEQEAALAEIARATDGRRR